MTVQQIVRYELDAETVVGFEVELGPGYHPAGAEEVVGRIKEAVDPAVQAARAVLEKVKETRPDEISLKFGIKVSGTMNWWVAKAATESNFEVTLTWRPDPERPEGPGE
ncbi:hypothetical protein JOL79_21145 [Microbispora sp. RL4-1S]|uniref:Trypsin-co-occurring domain-containing protein n=1 Tax=Microbispora oryzae TaxID=2806554 RepID=A0A941ARM3_9ACTN|nr:CU044_2847 family protein [Microbispora oryzae]MBP2706319.1 hypothetical protein [Microbispora oryzae]